MPARHSPKVSACLLGAPPRLRWLTHRLTLWTRSDRHTFGQHSRSGMTFRHDPRMRRRLLSLLAGALAALSAWGALAIAVQGDVVGLARLEASGEFTDARGRASLVTYPGHGEIDLTLHGFPEGSKSFVVWLVRDRGRAFVGGAFPQRSTTTYDLSTVVPGSRRVSRRHTKAAHHLAIKLMGDRRLERILNRERDSDWRDAMQPKGKPVVRGPVSRCENGFCQP
jgi:hypothetical protein